MRKCFGIQLYTRRYSSAILITLSFACAVIILELARNSLQRKSQSAGAFCSTNCTPTNQNCTSRKTLTTDFGINYSLECDGFLFSRHAPSAHGQGYWLDKVVSAVNSINLPVLQGDPAIPSSLLRSARPCAAVALHIYDETKLAWESFVQRSHVPILLSPWASHECSNRQESRCVFSGNEMLRFLEEYDLTGNYPYNLSYSRNGYELRYWTIPADSVTYSPPPSGTIKDRPLLYMKGLDGIMGPLTLARLLAKEAGFSDDQVTLLQYDSFNHYAKNDYQAALQRAPFMIAFTPHDNLANFIIEARSMDVPIFLLQPVEYLPYSFEYSAGDCAITSWNETSILQRFNNFLDDLEAKRFRPRHEVMARMSPNCSGHMLLLLLKDEGLVHMDSNDMTRLIDYIAYGCYHPLRPRMCRP